MPALLLMTLLAATPPHPPHALKFSMTEDLSATAAAAAVWGAEALLKSEFAPTTCKWCDRNPDGSDSLNGFDSWGKHLVWGKTGTADTLSNVLAVALPVGVAGMDWAFATEDGAEGDTLQDLVMIAEATAVNGVVDTGVKYIAGRQRPYAHYAGVVGPSSRDDNLSFYSGHTSFAFAVASSAGAIASLRGYSHAWVVWAVGMPVAAAVGYFRVAAEKHYLTDVLVGAAAGGLIGAGIPLLFHRRVGPATVQLVPGPESLSLVGVF